MKLSDEIIRSAQKVSRLEAKLKEYQKAVSALALSMDVNSEFCDIVDTIGPVSDAVNNLYNLNLQVEDQGT